MTLTDENGKTLAVDDFGGNVQVTWVIPAAQASDIDTSVAELYHVADEGTVTAVPAAFTKNADGSVTVVFQTTHFSSYAVVNGSKTTSSASSAGNPKTGASSSPTVPAVALLGLAVSAVAAITRRRKK